MSGRSIVQTAAKLAALGLIVLLAAGCWNRRELNTLAIQLGVGIDKVGDEYRLSAQVVDPGEVASAHGGSSSRTPVNLYRSSGPTLFEAFRRLTLTSPRKMYAAHIRVLIIGERLAREGIANVLDLLSRDAEVRTDFDIIIAKGTTAEQVLNILTPMEKIPANKLYLALDTSERAWAPTTTFTLDQLITQLATAGNNPVLTGVKIKGNKKIGQTSRNVNRISPEAELVLAGLAAFRGPRLVGWLNESESKGYNLLMDNVQSTAITLTCPDRNKLALEVIRSSTRLKGLVRDGKPVIHVKVKTEANIAEVNCRIDIDDPDTIKLLEEQAAEKGIRQMEQAVEVAQVRYSSDFLGFGQAIYRSNPRYWHRNEKDWDRLFKQVRVEYSNDFIIRKIGTTGNSFVHDIKE